MRRLTDSARRARDVLARENAVLPAECERVAVRELEKTLSEFFVLTGGVSLKVERGDKLVISVSAKAERIKPFGVL